MCGGHCWLASILFVTPLQKNVPVTAARLRRTIGFRADLIRRHGPEPIQRAFDLDFDEFDAPETHPDLNLLPEDVRLVLVE
ncbi:hypothetical protein OG930_32975 [Streptomyces sp. NBC_01799]|nr:hypothetical protein OG930_32975 [Streptomyces sp. NBC_01799]